MRTWIGWIWIGLLGTGLLVLGPGHAQTPRTNSALSPLFACMSVTDVASRARCFDQAAADLKAAETAGKLTILTPEVIARAQVDAFGDKAAGVSDVANSARTDAVPAGAAAPSPAPRDPDRVTLAVKEIQPARGGNLRFVMVNGQVWRQTDGLNMGGIGKGPWTAEIRKAALGSFLLKLNGKTAVRVERES